MKFDLANWSPDVKGVTGVVVLVTTIIGASWRAADYIGGQIYDFARGQERIVERLDDMKKTLAMTIPRIEVLEHDAAIAATAAAAAKAKVEDMKEDLQVLKGIGLQNLSVSQSHSADIKATRDALSPPTQPQ